jgi:hypothetical protein
MSGPPDVAAAIAAAVESMTVVVLCYPGEHDQLQAALDVALAEGRVPRPVRLLAQPAIPPGRVLVVPRGSLLYGGG